MTLSLSPGALAGDSISVDYIPPIDAPRLRDDDQGALAVAAFSLVIDNRTDAAPAAEMAEIDVTGATLTITFSEGLSQLTDGPPPASAFSLAGTSATATSMSIEANVVTLQLSPAAREGDSIVLSYDPPSTGGMADADQGPESCRDVLTDRQQLDRYGSSAPARGRGG